MGRTERHPLLHVLFHGHLWLAVGAIAQVWWIGVPVGRPASLRAYGIVALAVLCGYGGMRLLRMRLPDLTASSMMIWYRSHARWMWMSVLGCGLASVILAWPWRQEFARSLWLPVLLTTAYTLPLPLSRGRPWGLRRIPHMKAFIIGFVWACVVVVLPASVDRQDLAPVGHDVWWLAVIWTCYFTAIAIAFDIRDMPHDLPALRTLPQALGPSWAKVLANLLLLPLLLLLLATAAGVSLPIGPGQGNLGAGPSSALPVIGLIGTGLLIAKAEPDRPWWYWEFLLDGSLILLPVLAWIGLAI